MEDKQVMVEVDNVTVRFNLANQKVDNLKEYFIKLVTKKLRFTEFWALNDISFTVEKRDRVGVLGFNGAGKSTMLKLLCRVTAPTEGEIDLYGRIASMLEVGTGFNGEMTGRENVYMNGAILGMTKAEIASKLDEIVDFILHDLHSGATLNEIIGAYDRQPKQEVITIVDKQEYKALMDYVKKVDPKAFVTVYSVNDMRYQPKVK